MMELREKIARAIQGQCDRGLDALWRDWLPEADAVLEVLDQQKPAVWMQSNHLSVFQNLLPGSSMSLARCSSAKAQGDFIPLYAAPGAQAAVPDGWQPIETAPEGRLLVVGWLDSEDAEDPERHDFDWLEDGAWVVHAGSVEYADMVAPPGSRMPSQRAPYTHWIDLPPIPAAPKPEGK